jgi:hypothetical protein
MPGKLLDIRRYAAALLTFVAALSLQAALDVKWWSPACDLTADGGGVYASGFPFPAARPTVMSLEFAWMPHVQALNLIVLAAVLYPLIAFAHGKVTGWLPSTRWPLAWIALSLALMVGGVTALMTAELGRPVLSIADQGYDHYWDFRPAALVSGRCRR